MALAWSDWPAADRDAWCRATSPAGNIFEEAGRAAGWAASTQRAVQYDYARWLGFLAAIDPDSLRLDPIVRASPSRLRRFLHHLQETVRSVSQLMMMRHLRDALLAMVPDWPRGELDRVVAQLERNCRPRAKRPRVVHTGRLVALGEALMNSVPPEGPLADEDLLAYRDGLMIALLATRPLRRRNFAAILIGEHLLWVGDRFVLVFTASETKTRTPLEMNIPDALVPRLKHYLARIRPCFPGAADHSALWAGFKRRGLSGQAVYEAITARTRAAFGHAVNPHLFRDCAVTTIAMTAPDQIGVAQDLLGHVSGRTTHAHYNQARAIDASRLYATVLAAAGSPADGRSATRHSKETDPCVR